MAHNEDFVPKSQSSPRPGPFLAKVVSHLDPTYMGILEVEILRPVGNTSSEGQTHQVKYMSPFYGVTGVEHAVAGEDIPDDHNNTQKSYGMWMIPPDPGTTVVVIFIDGDPKMGYWIGCVQDENMNFMVPGLAATNFISNIPDDIDPNTRAPVSEYNKKVNNTPMDPTKVKKPYHPIAVALHDSGLLYDDTRGITTSSARRETPSMVFGISTPGPLDKKQNARRGPIGKMEHRIRNAPVSRLGGSTFVMDDGDDKFLRKASAAEAGPSYAAVEQDDTDGDISIPHNELIRLRTRTGHQILLHNSEDLIYIGNGRGTSWIELTSNGKIDIYASDSVSIHTEQDFNFFAGRDVNIQATRNINMHADGAFHVEAASDVNIIIGNDGKITTKNNLHLNSGGEHKETASKIHMNGPTAARATRLTRYALPKSNIDVDETAYYTSILKRIPTQEPYPHHENLDPLRFSSANTDRDGETRYNTTKSPFFDTVQSTDDSPNETTKSAAELWKKYSTITDTFAKIKGTEE